MSSSVLKTFIKKINASAITVAEDLLAVEEPLEISLVYGGKNNRTIKNISVTMRTPGNDKELATGFLFTEGILEEINQIKKIVSDELIENKVTVDLTEETNVDLQKLERHFYTTSSCGICGKSSIDAIITVTSPKLKVESLMLSTEVIYQLPLKLRQQQSVFESTGGLHASALFDITGNLILVREDVGRHNALDKLIGAALNQNMLPLSDCILLLSGRASFELIQKAAMAGIKFVAAVGSPSSLAVELAKEFDITLIGFLREQRFNIYCGEKRIL